MDCAGGPFDDRVHENVVQRDRQQQQECADHSNLTSESSYDSTITKKQGYLVTGSNPQPVWIGEFGTCNTSPACVNSTSNANNGYWFGFLSDYIKTHNLDWSYWSINGTEATGNTRAWGAAETYGVLNAQWNGSALPALTTALQGMMNH